MLCVGLQETRTHVPFRVHSIRLCDLLWRRFIVCPLTSASNRLKSSVDWTIRWQFLFDTFLWWSQRTHPELQVLSAAPPHRGPARQRIAPAAVAVATQPAPKRLTTVQPIRLRPVSNINGRERLPLVSRYILLPFRSQCARSTRVSNRVGLSDR